jgi:hypothetical protein
MRLIYVDTTREKLLRFRFIVLLSTISNNSSKRYFNDLKKMFSDKFLICNRDVV